MIVEGVSDPLILQAASRLCDAAGQPSLSHDVALLPAGGTPKDIVQLAAFIAGEQMAGVVLLDDDDAGRKTEKLLDDKFHGLVPVVRSYGSPGSTDAPTGFEIEDLIDRAYYVELVNRSHSDIPGYAPFSVSDLDSQPIVDAVTSRFKQQGLGGFQKLRPAIEFRAAVELGFLPDAPTLERFGELFARIGKILKGATR
jgi:hypothetical protein